MKKTNSFEMTFKKEFLRGHGIYDGIISFNEYLKYTTITLFPLFTLYKPHLLVYDLCQTLQFIK